MVNIELLEKHKNIILNLAILIFAAFITLQFYKSGEKQINSLISQREDELKKNMNIEEIVGFEKKIEDYKKVFVKKDLSSVMSTLSSIAADSRVTIVSIKPVGEEVNKDYIKSSFLITLTTSNYHFLGNFISRVEKNKDIYLIDEVSIRSVASGYEVEDSQAILNINLKVSTISYL